MTPFERRLSIDPQSALQAVVDHHRILKLMAMGYAAPAGLSLRDLKTHYAIAGKTAKDVLKHFEETIIEKK